MSYIIVVVIAFLLFPVVVSGLAQLSKYFDERTVSRSNGTRRSRPAV
jgi:hypothetical protein